MKHNYTKEQVSQFGVYAIVGPNGKRYVGSTTVSFYMRWHRHFSTLKRGTHHSRKLQNAWNKHGEDAFEFVILEVLQDRTECISKEIENITLYKATEQKYGYNMLKVIRNRFDYSVSDATRKRMSKAQMGHKLSEETKRKIGAHQIGRKASIETKQKQLAKQQKKVVRSDGMVFNSLKEAASVIGAQGTNISCSIKKGHKCKGFTFKYL